MCTVPETKVPPPPPPQPPPPSCAYGVDIVRPNSEFDINLNILCQWTDNIELRTACLRRNICLYEQPFTYKYKYFESIIQVGPKCGLVALAMLLNREVTDDEAFNIAKLEGYSINGEMFSCKNMGKLVRKALNLIELENVHYELIKGGLFSEVVIQRLLDGAVMLVPYDADFDHSPCLKQGHTAHWALICGVIIVNDPNGDYTDNPDNIYVLAKHGKSKYLAAWRLIDLAKSNKNLWEFAPKRGADGWTYVLPEGGIGGDNGLRNQFLIFEGI